MKARALICDDSQRFSIEDVVLPDAGTNRVVVRTCFSGVSVGTEFALVRNKISWGPYPLCTGYQGVGVVEDVGTDVGGYKTGDVVYFRDNKAISLADGKKVSAVTGSHCSHASIDPADTHGLAILPEGVSYDAASLYVMPAVGLYGVDMANPRMGETVVVFGVGPIGLGVVAACAHRGCVVIAVDLESARLDTAQRLGADVVIHGSDQNVEKMVGEYAPEGADVVFEATGIPACIDSAIGLCKTYGKFVWQGNYGADPVSMHFLTPHGKRLQMFFPCDDGLEPCRKAVLKNMASGALEWGKTITHRIDSDDAPLFFESINKGTADGLVCGTVKWSE